THGTSSRCGDVSFGEALGTACDIISAVVQMRVLRRMSRNIKPNRDLAVASIMVTHVTEKVASMRRFLVLGIVAVLALAGCGGGEGRGGSSSGSSPGMPSTKGATFVYLHNLEVITDWDPASSYSNEIIAMQNIYDSLTVYNHLTRRASARL